MKQILFSLLLVLGFMGKAQNFEHIANGEKIKYRIHYGVLNAGYAELTAKRVNYLGRPHLYVRGDGWTTGAVKAFFKVKDVYESFIDIKTGLPSYYVRNVREGNYTQHYQTVFNHDDNTLILTDKKTPSNGSKIIKVPDGIQDMLSAFYYLREKNPSQLKKGAVLNLNVWIDDEMFPFQLKITGEETISTKLGKVNCLVIVPLVKSGRVFKSKEGVKMWVSNDAYHIPLAIEAELAVGSLRADIESYSHSSQLKIIP